MRLLRSVWCQFVLIGVVLFVLDRALFPEPKPIIGPPNAERVALQVQALTQLQGKPLSTAQQQMIKARELRDELLFMGFAPWIHRRRSGCSAPSYSEHAVYGSGARR